ncbi:MAG: Glutaredoxin [Dehalococcoidia bacterium]|nr:Glutaredoxin [Dehalococcoidia bacterium]
MASLAISMALGTERVTTDVVEANEFAELSEHYQVRGVPTTIINDATSVVGAMPPMHFLEELQDFFSAAETPEEEAP